jgi:hypothetical protein
MTAQKEGAIMKRTVFVCVFACVFLSALSAQDRQSATVSVGDYPTVTVDLAPPSDTSTENASLELTLNGSSAASGGTVHVTLAGSTHDFTSFPSTESFPIGCSPPSVCHFNVTAEWDNADKKYTITLNRTGSGNWNTFTRVSVDLPGATGDYQLEVAVFGADPSWIADVSPERRVAAHPQAGTLRFADVMISDMLTIYPIVPAGGGFDTIEIPLSLEEGAAAYAIADTDVGVYVGDDEILHTTATNLDATLTTPTVDSYLITITGPAGDADWPNLNRIEIDNANGHTLQLDVAIRALNGGADVTVDGLALGGVSPRTAAPPEIVDWQSDPLTANAAMSLVFQADGVAPHLFTGVMPGAATGDATLIHTGTTDGSGHYTYTVQAPGSATGGGTATITIDDPITPGLTFDDIKGQINSWTVVTEFANPIAPPSNLRFGADYDQDGDPLEAAEIILPSSTGPNTYPVSQVVGTYLDGRLEITNTGGGIVRITGATAPPAYDWEEDGGYLAATFPDESPFPVPGSAEGELIARFEPVLTLATPIDLEGGQSAWLDVRYVPVGVTIDAEDWPIEIQYSGHPLETYAVGDWEDPIFFSAIPVVVRTQATAQSDDERLDFVAVLDKSGSMSGSASYSPGSLLVTKMDGLHAAGALLYRIMDTIGDDDDRTAVIVYSSDADDALPLNVLTATPPVGTPTPAEAFDLPNVGGASAVAASLTPGGTTSISDALALAVDILHAAPDIDTPPVTRSTSFLLMTDGRHNTGTGNAWTNVSSLGTDFAEALTIDPESSEANSLVESTQLFVVGLGEDGANLEAAALKQLAGGVQANGSGAELVYRFSGGGYRQSLDIDSLGIYFAQILSGSFFEAQIPNDDPYELEPGITEPLSIVLTSSTNAAFFYVTWSDPRFDVYFDITDPSGFQHKGIRGTGYTYFPVPDMERFFAQHGNGPGGEWELSVTATPITDNVELPETIHIEYAAFVTDPVVHAEFGADGSVVGAGDSLVLRASLSEAGAPIRGAECTALVTVPLVGLGEFLYANAEDVDIPASDADDSQDRPVVELLDAIMAANPDGLERVTVPLAMHDDGEDGDATAGDGIYTVVVADSGDATTEHNGIYNYRFLAEGTTLIGEPFERTFALSGYITSIVAPDETDTSLHVTGPRTAYVRIEPRDRFGHLVDPIAARSYDVLPVDPSRLDFEVAPERDRFDGSVVYRLTATTGSFSPYRRAEDLVRVDVAPVTPSETQVVLEADQYLSLFALDVVGGYLVLPASLGVNSSWFVGLRGRMNPGRFFSCEAETALAMTQTTAADTITLLQYGGNVTANIPLLLGPTRPYATLGFGGMTYLGATIETSAELTYGIGLRWYPQWEMRGGVSLEARGLLQFDPLGGGPVSAYQILVGVNRSF